jgi:hypothetical protein
MGRSTSGNWLGRWIAEGSDAIVSLLFPAGCRLCKKLLTRATRVPICEECLASFVPMPQSVCEVCGAAPETSFLLEAAQTAAADDAGSEPHTCAACRVQTYGFDQARTTRGTTSPWSARSSCSNLSGSTRWVRGLRTGWRKWCVVSRRPSQWMLWYQYRCNRQREHEGGYNQADLIARPLAKRLGLPYRGVLLVRKRPRPDSKY